MTVLTSDAVAFEAEWGVGLGESDGELESFGHKPEFWAEVTALRAHPDLDKAMRHSVRSAIDYFHQNQVMHRNIKDVGRLILGLVALYLDATGGLTHRRLRALSGQTGVISAGTATAVLFRLRTIGYVTRDEVGGGGRSRRYRPTDDMRQTFRRRLQIELQATAMVAPGTAALLPRYDEPEVVASVFAVMGREAVQAARNPNPEVDPLNRLSVRSAGLLVLYDMIHAADDGGPLAGPAELEVTVAAMARKYEISRSHVLSLLRDLEAAGFIARVGRDGRWALLPALRETLTTFFAIIYAGMDRVFAEAVAQAERPDV